MDGFFETTYQQARQRFVQTCGEHGAKLHSYTHDSFKGKHSSELAIDTARFGDSNASKVLVLISGTHGVEGFCGSACQVAAVKSESYDNLSADVSVLLIHALNPYGFAAIRRVNEDNVDLNRNVVQDFESVIEYNREYDLLNDGLNPSVWRNNDPQDGDEQISAFMKAHGMPKFQSVVSIGQYRHPKGLFFGGVRKTASTQILQEIIDSEFQHSKLLGIVDYHTGLGPSGVGELICMDSEESEAYRRCVAWYGSTVKSTKSRTEAGRSVSAEVGGSIDRAFSNGHSMATYVAIEFGTVPVPAVLRALRAENWLQHYGELNSVQGLAIKSDLKAAFYPENDTWKSAVLARSREVVGAAMIGLAKA